MAFDSASIARNRDYFAHKLEAQKQRNDVLHAVQGDTRFDFVLVDTRGSEALCPGTHTGGMVHSSSGSTGKGRPVAA
jgi:hypothetical protein